MNKIPINLDECFEELAKIFVKTKLQPEYANYKFKEKEESEAVAELHNNFARDLRNVWRLWHQEPLTRWFNNLGIYHADDMSGIILVSFHRHLNKKDIKLKEQVKHYIDYWKRTGCKDGNPLNGTIVKAGEIY